MEMTWMTASDDVLTQLPPGVQSKGTVGDFWLWAFSDLRQNNVRGIFSEWLVARLLGIEHVARDPWAAHDLTSPEGIRLEVKSSAYVQAWERTGPPRIVFDGLKGCIWDPTLGRAKVATYNADLYVFCLHVERDSAIWSALDVSKWRFWLVPRSRIAELGLKQVSLTTLRKSADRYGPEMSAAEFVSTGREVIAALVSNPSAYG